jgi:hypothetical protein
MASATLSVEVRGGVKNQRQPNLIVELLMTPDALSLLLAGTLQTLVKLGSRPSYLHLIYAGAI